jgi:hypothetical protein
MFSNSFPAGRNIKLCPRMTFQKPVVLCCSRSLDWSIHPELIISSKSICKEHCCAPLLLCSSPIKAGKISYFLRWIFLPCYYYSCVVVVVVVGGCAFSALVESNEVYTLPKTKVYFFMITISLNFYVEIIHHTGPIQYRTDCMHGI